jgi:stage II sporulation protein GA (sporulation sigma-E factor processing peptidase)
MIVYADLVFLSNLLIDGVILQTTAWTRKIRVPPWRILAASAFGASYVVMMFFPSMSILYTFSLKCIFSGMMIFIAFGFGGSAHFFRNIAAFYFVNFAAAGAIFAAHYFFQSSGEVLNGIWVTRSGGFGFQLKVGLLFTAVLFLLSIWFYRNFLRSAKQREQLTEFLAEVQVKLGDSQIRCPGLIDTGNHLYDPLTKTPVMVMEASLWKGMLPESWLQLISSNHTEQIMQDIGKESLPWEERLRWVPYRGINKATQFMLAIKPDKVVIGYMGKEKEIDKVLIGLNGNSFSADGSYQAIIHPMLIND